MSDLLSISAVKKQAAHGPVQARLHVQVETAQQKETRDGKPFWEVVMVDAAGRLTIRAWSDSPMFEACAGLAGGAFLEVQGEFAQHAAFGLEAKRWNCRDLQPDEKTALLGGDPELRARQEADFSFIAETIGGLRDPRLRALGCKFLEEMGERFRRTAAARNYHHARRGGLVEHTAQMMRAAVAVAGVYPALNRDLLVSGVLFHDIGKLWENALPENGFTMAFDERGELLGHITIGIELVNGLWRKLMESEEAATWKTLEPASEDVRLHLLHLIAAHHGTHEFGSPVDPKTPEAHALHHLDNLDAKVEMIFAGYGTAAFIAPRIQERVRPLPGNLVTPLKKME